MVLQAPLFLFGLFAIAIPVIIHLVNLRKPKKVLFTNVAFIKQVEKVTSNQRRLKHYLILLSRILFLVFLVLVFCQPFIPAADSAFGKTETINAYLDNSGSMLNETESGGISLLDKAVDEVSRIGNNFPEQVQINLLTNNFDASHFRDLNKRNLNDYLGAVSFSPASRKTDIIYSRLVQNPSSDAVTFWFSDFQKATFDPTFLSKIDTVSKLNLIKLNPASAGNIFIDSVSLENEFVRTNENNRLLVKLLNSGTEDINSLSLKLYIGARQAATASINIKAKSAAVTYIDFRITDNASQLCRIVVEDQPVTFDNTFYFTLKRAGSIRILDISDRALPVTRHLFSNEPIFQYSHLEANAVNSNVLSQADLVQVNELPHVNSSLADHLSRYVKNGGNLIIIPDSKIKADAYSGVFNSLGLVIHTVSDTAVSQLALPDIRNPFFRNIFSELDKRLQMPRSSKILNWPRSEADLLLFKNGNRFLSQFSAGKGKVFVFAAPFSAESNEFSQNALFVPVMYKLALVSHESEQQLAYNFAQRTFALPVSNVDIRKNVFSLEQDSLKFIPEQQLRGGKMVFTIPAEMVEAGFYDLKHTDSVLTTLAFNYPKNESFLETYSVDELRQLIPNKNVKIYEAGANAGFSEQFIRDTKGTSLWQYCLLISLFFLLVEILLIRFL